MSNLREIVALAERSLARRSQVRRWKDREMEETVTRDKHLDRLVCDRR
jgi:hypothetical protein